MSGDAGATAPLLVDRRGAVAVLTLNRPARRNALSNPLLDAIRGEVERACADTSVRSLVIHGGSMFSAGADLDEVLAINDRRRARAHLLHFRRTLEAIETARLPIIAAISGHCLTGGLELALGCDLRVADASARFAMTSSRIGGLAGAGGTQRLPRLIGTSRAMYLMMLAEQISADRALEVGLIDVLADEGSALAQALELGETIAARAPLSIEYLKRAVHQGLQLPMSDGLDIELELACEIFETADRDEGIAAMREKREPQFQGH